MYIYNKKIVPTTPKIQNTKKINVSLEDVLLSFLSSEVKGDNIIITYSISYFNIPQGINEYEIENKIEPSSLKNVIKDTFNDFKEFEIYSLSAKQVKILFDMRKFLLKATYPTKVVNRGYGKSVLKLNRAVPELVKQTSSGIISQMFSDIMASIIRHDRRKYDKIFSGLGNWVVSKNSFVSAEYDQYKNEFNLELKNRYNLIYYYLDNKKAHF